MTRTRARDPVDQNAGLVRGEHTVPDSTQNAAGRALMWLRDTRGVQNWIMMRHGLFGRS